MSAAQSALALLSSIAWLEPLTRGDGRRTAVTGRVALGAQPYRVTLVIIPPGGPTSSSITNLGGPTSPGTLTGGPRDSGIIYTGPEGP
jgi:hypothetical protein